MLQKISDEIFDASNNIVNDISNIIKSDINTVSKINGIEYHKNRIIESTKQLKVLAEQLASDVEICDAKLAAAGIKRPHECPVYKRLSIHLMELSKEES